MNFATAFYLAAQVPPRFSGALLVLLVAAGLLMHWQRPPATAARGVIALDWQRAVLTVCGVGLLAIFQALWLPHDNRAVTVVHLLVYLVLFLARDRNQRNDVAAPAVAFTTLLSLLLLLSFPLPVLRDIAWVEKIGGYRFQSYFSEPSLASFVLIFNLHHLWLRGLERPWARPLVLINLICLVPTFSGSGMMLLALLVVTHLRHNFSWRQALLFLLLLAVTLFGLRTLFTAAFDQMLIARAAGLLGNQTDNSTFLRFVVPWLFIRDLVQDDVHFWLGTGIGGLVDFIESNHHRLWYLVDYQGQTLVNLNNGYAIVLSLLGVPLGLLLTGAVVWRVWTSPAEPTSKVLFLAYPFFSGFVIHPMPWLLLALAMARLRQPTPAAPGEVPTPTQPAPGEARPVGAGPIGR